MKIEKQNFKTLKICLTTLLIGLLIGAWIAYASTPSSTFTISGGVYPGAPSYTIWNEGSDYFAKDANGLLAYSGTNAATIIQLCIDAGEVVVVNNDVTLTSGIMLNNSHSYKELNFVGEITINYDGPAFTLGADGSTVYYLTLKALNIYGQDKTVGRYGVYLVNAARCHIEISSILVCDIGLYLYGLYGAVADNRFFIGTIAAGNIGVKMDGTSDSYHTQGNKFIIDYIGPNVDYGVYIDDYGQYNTFIGTIDEPTVVNVYDDSGGNFFWGFVGLNRTLGGYGDIFIRNYMLELPQAHTISIGAGATSYVVSFPYWNDGSTDYLAFATPHWSTSYWISSKGAGGFNINFTSAVPGGGSSFDYFTLRSS